MLTPILVFGVLFQSAWHRPWTEILVPESERAHAVQQQEHRRQEQDRERFAQKYKNLVDAIQRFSDTYNKAHGNTWPVKEAEALRKACHDLEHNMH